MDISGLTTTEAIRALLGISESGHELDDQVFTDLDIETELTFSLDLWLTEAAATDVNTVLLTGTIKAVSALSLCAKYLGALLLIPSLSSATAKMLSDGQDEFQRQDRDFLQMSKDFQAKLGMYQAALLSALAVTANTTTFAVMGRAIPNFDPVTGI